MTLNAVVKEKKRLLDKMSPELREVAEQLDRSACKSALGVLKLCYQDGLRLKTVHRDTAKYGARSIELLAAYRGVSPQTLYLNIRLVDNWTEEEIEELCERSHDASQQITKSHLFVLCQLDSPEQREVLLNRFFDEHMLMVNSCGVRLHKLRCNLCCGR